MITTYTTYADVRAVLGVSTDEVEDVTLALSVYADSLELELMDLGSALPALYAMTTLVAVLDRTAAQQRFVLLTSMFATYQVAQHLSQALPMFSPKTISDGKANLSRFADGPYKTTIELVANQYGRLRVQLSAAFAALSSSTQIQTPTLPYLAGISVTPDRVTGS